ncbi:MAG: VWA domain-containing protein [Deltaproteobacteria bacterium]|nr:VWA domain-containing protein [Deltaproteobacteria bacterium]
MFLAFFYALRAHGIRVSTTEWLSLVQALGRGFDRASLSTFYTLSKSLLVKRETQYDAFDRAFAVTFEGLEGTIDVTDELLSWLDQPIPKQELNDDERALLQAMDTETLRDELRKRLAEQKERHDGGSHWVGTGGTSPFGHGGQNPQGIQIGATGTGARSAVAVAGERRFANLRADRVLDVRQLGAALRRLRRLARDDGVPELDVEASIDQSAKQAEIELVFRPPRKNRVKLLLLMDVGGSMDPYADLCSRLFAAAHQSTHFAAFKTYFFHNCVYEKLYTDLERGDGVWTRDVVGGLDQTWRVVVVGDAWMSPYELLQDTSYFTFGDKKTPGIEWLRRIAGKARASAWLNPEGRRIWGAPTVKSIRQIFPMFELTLDGLDRAVDHLRGARPVEPGADTPSSSGR